MAVVMLRERASPPTVCLAPAGQHGSRAGRGEFVTGFRVTATTDSRHTIQRWIDVDEGRVFVGCPTQDPDKESEAMFDLPVPVGDSIIHQRTKGLSVCHSCPSVCHAVCMSV